MFRVKNDINVRIQNNKRYLIQYGLCLKMAGNVLSIMLHFLYLLTYLILMHFMMRMHFKTLKVVA